MFDFFKKKRQETENFVNEMYRQGDVLLVRVAAMPADAQPMRVRGDAVVLASGRATGHSHIIKKEFARPFFSLGQIYIEVFAGAELLHEEHFAIELPAGAYRVVRQREFAPAQNLTVID